MPTVASYTVRLRLQVDDSSTRKLDPVLKGVEKTTRGIGRNVTSLDRGFRSLYRTLAAYGAFRLVRGAVAGAIEISSSYETAQNAITGLIVSFDALSVAAAKPLGKTIFEQLRRDAAKGIGELNNYLEAYQFIYAPARNAGASREQIRQLTRLSLAAGFSIQGQRGLTTAPLDIQQALSGNAGERTTPIANLALRAIGQSVSGFNQLPLQQKLALLLQGFEKVGQSADLLADTFEAQAATFKDSGKQFVAAISDPAYQRLRTALVAVNKELEAQPGYFDEMTQSARLAVAELARVPGSVANALAPYATLETAANSLGAAFDQAAVRLRTFTALLGLAGDVGHSVASFVGPLLDKIPGSSFVSRYVFSSTGDAATTLDTLGGLSSFFSIQQQNAQGRFNALSGQGPVAPNLYGTVATGISTAQTEFLARLTTPDPFAFKSALDESMSGLVDSLQAAANDETKAVQDDKEKTIKVELKQRVEWGNDRSLALGLTDALEQVLDQVYRAGRESRTGLLP